MVVYEWHPLKWLGRYAASRSAPILVELTATAYGVRVTAIVSE